MQTLTLSIPNAHVKIFSDGLQEFASAITARVDEHAAQQQIILYFEDPPNQHEISARLALLAQLANIPAPQPNYEDVPKTDWLSHVYRGLHPLQLGRFYVYGSHSTAAAPAASIPIRVDAATAFGSGHHATTAACLLALSDLANHKQPQRMLDLGCGSGILAIGMAKLFHKKLWALDIDSEAVRVTQTNAHINECERFIRTAVGGSDSPYLKIHTPYNLITANILARPLTQMAAELSHALAPNGILILSGLITAQEQFVANAYLRHGLRRVKQYRRDEWSALVLKK